MPYPHVDEDGTTHGVGDMGECNDVLWIEAGDLEAAEYHDRAADGESLHDGMAIDLYWNCGDPEWRGVRVPADVPS
jgi:hypothetical protein